MYITYILKSEVNGRYYVGSTDDLENRLHRHNSGQEKWTKRFLPWKLVHQELFNTRSEAYKRELQIKRYKGGDAFKKLLNLGGFV